MEFWTVVHSDTGEPVLPFDANPESDDEGMLVYLSKIAAEASARHQAETYDLTCQAKRLADLYPLGFERT
jgi:hypothetical protein